MAPTEATILTNFLLPPAQLPSIISLHAFTQLFPRAQQSSPQIKVLYRDLQHQRARLADSVGRNIVTEVKRGNVEKREVIRARRTAEREPQDDEVDIENAVSCVVVESYRRRKLMCGTVEQWPNFQLASLKSSLFEVDNTRARKGCRRNGGRNSKRRRRD